VPRAQTLDGSEAFYEAVPAPSRAPATRVWLHPRPRSVSTMDADAYKRQAAARALDFVSAGMRLGLGTGSTAAHFIELLAARVRVTAPPPPPAAAGGGAPPPAAPPGPPPGRRAPASSPFPAPTAHSPLAAARPALPRGEFPAARPAAPPNEKHPTPTPLPF